VATLEVYPDTKICNKCGVAQNRSEYYKHARTRDGLHPSCKACSKIRYQTWAKSERGKERIAATQATRGGRKVLALCRVLRGICPCCVCGESEPACIDFHHIVPAEKLFELARTRSVNELISEAKKCAPVCRNCHAKLHAGVIAPELHPLTDNDIEEALRITGSRLMREGGIWS
jgi:hypothetical protein